MVGWLVGSTGGSGSTGVSLNNESQRAFVQHTGNGLHSLSIDFSYIPDQTLSFDIQAISTSRLVGLGSQSRLHSRSGFTLSFLNLLNSSLGKVSVVNATNPSTIGSSENLVDGLLHNYSASLSDFALLAGLDNTDPISKFSLSFWASGQTSSIHTVSAATVWIDNVNVSAVPIPTAIWLFGSGLIGLFGMRKKH